MQLQLFFRWFSSVMTHFSKIYVSHSLQKLHVKKDLGNKGDNSDNVLVLESVIGHVQFKAALNIELGCFEVQSSETEFKK